MRGYADDVTIFAAAGDPKEAAEAVIDGVRAFAAAVAPFGGTLSRLKCTMAANTPVARRALVLAAAGEGLQLHHEAKYLGAPSTGGGARRTAVTTERICAATARGARLARVPAMRAVADKLLPALVSSAALYGAAVQGLVPSKLAALRRSAAGASRRGHAAKRCCYTTVSLSHDPVVSYHAVVVKQWQLLWQSPSLPHGAAEDAWSHAKTVQTAATMRSSHYEGTSRGSSWHGTVHRLPPHDRWHLGP